MKSDQNYTIIVASDTKNSIKKFHVSSKNIKIFIFISSIVVFFLLALVFDYVKIGSHYVDNTRLTKENKKYRNDLNILNKDFSQLKREVQQLEDVSRKLKLITGINSSQLRGYEKTKLNSYLVSLSKAELNSEESKIKKDALMPSEKKDLDVFEHQISDSSEFVVKIKKWTEKTKLIKQDASLIYTDLLDKQRLLMNTPSILPTNGWVSSEFGYRNKNFYSDHEPYFHKGIDIAAKQGTPVVSTASGQIVYAGYDEDGFGKLIIINHNYNVKSYYAHLSKITVKYGDRVERGWKIGEVGNTGKSRGAHLHYEVRIFGIPINPKNYILDSYHSI